MGKYIVYTDGAIKGNGKPSAVSSSASIITNAKNETRFLVSIDQTLATSNKAELIGAIQALNYIKWPAEFTIYSDSEYLVKGFMERMAGWRKNGWKTKAGTEVSNVWEWQQLFELSLVHKVTMIHVKGHSGNEFNELADSLARTCLADPERFKRLKTYRKNKLIFL